MQEQKSQEHLTWSIWQNSPQPGVCRNNWVLPICTVRLLVNSYRIQVMEVKWDTCLWDPFTVTNGFGPFGGVLSPYLFTVYLDELSVQLDTTRTASGHSMPWLEKNLYALMRRCTYSSNFFIHSICVMLLANLHFFPSMYMCDDDWKH